MDRSVAERCILSVGWLADRPRTFQSAILQRARLVEVATGEEILSAGDEGGGIYGVVHGGVGAYVPQEIEGEKLVRILRTGAWFGYPDAVLALSKAFALCSASDTARDVRDEVGFFQTVRAAIVKAADSSGTSAADRDLAIRQIVNAAVASTEIVDILSAAGLSSPDISILSDEFLAEVGQMEKKNLALEALRKLLNDEIRSRSKSNVIETRKFSERLEEAIARYHTNAISTVEVLQELIALAKDVRDARSRGEETGLTPEEVAFYDALADNQSAVDVLGNDQLKIIAHELLKGLKANVSIDWAHRDSARARLRVLVKRILRKYGYPPDLEEAAVRGVLAQAEAMLSEMAL